MVLNKSQCMDCPLGQKEVAVIRGSTVVNILSVWSKKSFSGSAMFVLFPHTSETSMNVRAIFV